MNIQPLGDRILVQRLEPEETKKGGIIIPETAQEKAQQAKVIALGTGKKDEQGEIIPFDVKEGDTVLIDKWAGGEVTIDDKEYLILEENKLLAIIK